MRKISDDELKIIIENHQHWLKKDCVGWEDMRADLSWANLSRADLSWANLTGANLSGADLSEVDLSRTNLSRADLRGAGNIPYIPMACPEEGEFIGWKKASGCIVKLLIPEDARRSSATGRKCRCDKAKVLAIYNPDGTPAKENAAASSNDRLFIYTVGETVAVDDFDENRFNECAPGIHFFLNRKEAETYVV